MKASRVIDNLTNVRFQETKASFLNFFCLILENRTLSLSI